MKRLLLAAILAGLCSAAGLTADQAPLRTPPLSPDFAKGCKLVLPDAGEQSYRKIAWRASVLHGVVDAQNGDRPVMIVLMNGHPLGCT